MEALPGTEPGVRIDPSLGTIRIGTVSGAAPRPNVQAAPVSPSPSPPTSSVAASGVSATAAPKRDQVLVTASLGATVPSTDQPSAPRRNRAAAPTPMLPTSAASPPAEKATLKPNSHPAPPFGSTSFGPDCSHCAPLRSNDHAAPRALSSVHAPRSAVSPDPSSATAPPKLPAPTSSEGASFEPACLHLDLPRSNNHAPPIPPASSGAPTSAVSPSPDSATLVPKAPAIPGCPGCWSSARSFEPS